MPIHIEPVTYVLRAFEKGSGYGDEYITSLTIQRVGDTAIISGCSGQIGLSDYRDMMEELKRIGVTQVRWIRENRHTVKEIA